MTESDGSVALPRMPIPTVGWLAYGKDTEGNLFGMMQMDAAPGDALIEGLAARGHAIERDAIAGDVVAGLRDRARSLDRAGAFAPAGVGRAGARTQRSDVRGDRIAWLDEALRTHRRSAPAPTGSRRCGSGATATSCSGSRTSKRTTRSTRRARATRGIAIAFATTTRACCRACSTSMTGGTAGDGGALRLHTRPTGADADVDVRLAVRSSRSCPADLRARGAAGDARATRAGRLVQAPRASMKRSARRPVIVSARAAPPDHRHSQVAPAMWQAEHIRARLTRSIPACRVGVLGLPRGRPASGAARGRLRAHGDDQGARSGDGGRPRRHRRAFAQEPAEGDLRRVRACRHHRARGSARRVRLAAIRARSPSMPTGAVVGTSSLRREAQVRERYPELVVEVAARRHQHAVAQARRRTLRRAHRGRRRAEALGLRHRASRRCSSRTRACRRRGRARSRSNAAATVPSSLRRWRRSPIARRRWRRRRSARSRARWAAAASAARRVRRMGGGRAVAARAWSRARTERRAARRSATPKSHDTKARPSSAAISPTISSRAAPPRPSAVADGAAAVSVHPLARRRRRAGPLQASACS